MEKRVGIQSIFQEQSKIIELIALDNLPLTSTLEELIRTVEFVMPEIKSSILLFDESTQTLGKGIGPSLPEAYLNAIEGMKSGPCSGSCGTAVYHGKTVIVEDTEMDPLWEQFRDLAITYNLKSCWAKPIISSYKEVFGTIAFYHSQKSKPTALESDLIDTFANLAGLIISKKKTEQKLHLSYTVAEKSEAVLMRWKAEEGWPLEFVSNNVSQFGYSSDDFLSGKCNFDSIIYPADLDRVAEEVKYYSDFEINNFSQEYRIVTNSGEIKWIEDRTSVERNAQGDISHYQGIILDITERKETEKTIKFLANNDPLTKLPNRRSLMETLSAKLNQARINNTKLAVLFLDLDNFKDVNDLLGHSYGDQLLQDLAAKLTKRIPDHCIVSRISGDEFAFVLTDFSANQEIEVVCKAIIDVFQSPFIIDNKEFVVTASIGVSLFPDHEDNPETLLKYADLAMYSTKKSGKNNYQFYTTDLYDKVVQKKTLERELKTALRKDQFVLQYQPQVEVETGKVIGIEALIRWKHPVKGLLTPDEFLPLAEETGLIVSIDKWVLRKACLQVMAWRREGFEAPTVKVNLSGRQFYNEKLCENVTAVLEETELESSCLELEITEETLMRYTDRTVKVLDSLRKTGVKISVDDFGTGYSSLSYFKNIPMDTLKIDKSFIQQAATKQCDAAIIKSIITLADSLDVAVIIEGVETAEQLEFVKKANCRQAQGYLFSPPLSSEEAVKFFVSKTVSVDIK